MRIGCHKHRKIQRTATKKKVLKFKTITFLKNLLEELEGKFEEINQKMFF